MKTFEEYAKQQYPRLQKQYDIYCSTPESLIGKEVVAIRSGFSCGSEGGTKMIVDKIGGGSLHLKPIKGSVDDIKGVIGWGCDLEDAHNSFILI